MKWLHDSNTDQWNATTDQWRLGVQQSIYNTDWYGWIERLVPPHDRHESYACASAMEARKWCEAELKRW
jgi:hypothetical protein